MAKYNSIDTIPAKVFFDIMQSKNFQLLKPKPKEQGLEELFMSIYDDFFLQSDNFESKEYLRLISEKAFLNYKLSVINKTLEFLYFTKTTKQMRLDIIKALKDGCNIDIDADAPFADEVQRVLDMELGFIKNDLSFIEIDLIKMQATTNEKLHNYYDSIVSLSNIHERNIDEHITLAMYVALEKSATKKIEQRNKTVV